MKNALINPTIILQNYYQVAEVNSNTFPVAVPLFWEECPDDIIAYIDWYDPDTKTFSKIVPTTPTAEDNKQKAIQLLVNTDWVNEPDVYNPENTPHLLNRDDFLNYRVQIREQAVYPTAGNIDWPVKPEEQWSK